MIMLYKYLFYSYSYYIRKYDRLWDVGETYYVGGALTVGLTINILLFNLHSIVGILWYPEFLNYKHTFWGYLWPLIIPLALAIYLGVTGKYDRIYEEVAHLPSKKKRVYKVLNIIHLIVVFGGMILLSDYIRYYIRGADSPIFEWLESLRNQAV